MQPIEEQVIVDIVQNLSKPFARYYRQRRHLIKRPLTWFLNPDLIADGSASVAHDGSFFLQLKHIPSTVDDAHTVAHELEHYVLDEEQWPSVVFRTTAPPEARLTAILLNSFLDLPIERRLQAVGFNIRNPYLSNQSRLAEGIVTRPQLPNNALSINELINYTFYTLFSELIGQDYKQNPILTKIADFYPKETQSARNLLSVIKPRGYNTPANMRGIFWTFINNLGIDRDFTVENPGAKKPNL